MYYYLTNGKEWVMENPFKQDEYLRTTCATKAASFTYKRARNLLNRREKNISWVKDFHMVDTENGEVCEISKKYKGNSGVYVGKNDIKFDESIIDKIFEETKSIIGLTGYSEIQLQTFKKNLNDALSKYDSAESDILHALQTYKERNNGKKPQAHKMAKIGYKLDEVRDKHKRIKQCIRYVDVMQNAITYGYAIEKLKLELANAKDSAYEGRTEYYEEMLQILG